MNPTKAAMLAGAFRTLLAGALGWVVAKGYIPSDTLNVILLAVGSIGIAYWSIVTKQGPASEWYPMILGAARNLLTVFLTWAAGKGWIASDQVAPMIAAIGTIVAAFWSTEAKYLSVGVKRIASVILIGGFTMFGLGGCATFTGDTDQSAVFNAGEAFLGPVQTLGLVSQAGVVKIPNQACLALSSAMTAFNAAENTVRDPNYQSGNTSQQVLTALNNAISAAVLIAVQIAASAHQPMQAGPAKATLVTGDPTSDQWSTLNMQLQSAVANVKCTG